MILRIVLCCLALLHQCILSEAGFVQTAQFPSVHLQEVLTKDIYITQNEFGEIVVTSAGKGSDLRPGDLLTHGDTIRILSGGLESFIDSGESEVLVPVVDNTDERQGGNRLLSFVKLEDVRPRKIKARRGELAMDLEEGGPAPSVSTGGIVLGPGGAKRTTDKDYGPPPNGGGDCVTSRDCNNNTGQCVAGKCVCDKKKHPTMTGSYCQLDRPDLALKLKIDSMMKNQPGAKAKPGGAGGGGDSENANNKAAAEAAAAAAAALQAQREREERERGELLRREREQREEQDRQTREDMRRLREMEEAEAAAAAAASNAASAAPVDASSDDSSSSSSSSSEKAGKKGKPKAKGFKKKPPPVANSDNADATTTTAAGAGEKDPSEPTFDDLYGPGKAYPAPYVAGKLTSQEQLARYHKRYGKEPFLFTVRFREAPLGITFDNKIPSATVVENVVKSGLADQSDIKAGDQLVAVETFNTTLAPAKATQRIMSTLDFPRTLVFKAKVNMVDPNAAANKLKQRTFNLTVVYPPTLTTEITVRLSEWTPALDLTSPLHPAFAAAGLTSDSLSSEQFCPIFRMRAAQEASGCKLEPSEFRLSDELNALAESRVTGAAVGWEAEEASTLFSLLVQESRSRNLYVEPRPMAVVKRGECTFVEKARNMMREGATLGLVVNTDNELIDMPSGKEQVGDIKMPLAIARETDAALLHLAARTNDVWVVLSDSVSGLTPACDRIANLVEDLIDKWPHSVPPLSQAQIIANKPPDTKPRGLTEEGGRIAISGENGWAFFDYHLAMFGPQQVPLGPFRLQMALPPFGCDPGAYTVRIKDTVVAILRGGGCSFGIKVINAQKLGAKAVIIVNTDDMKTMRLMALPDEVPLIQIPCIMVSRRIQYYLEEQLRPFFPVDQHLISMQPTGIFGEYEKKNSLVLPVRLSNS